MIVILVALIVGIVWLHNKNKDEIEGTENSSSEEMVDSNSDSENNLEEENNEQNTESNKTENASEQNSSEENTQVTEDVQPQENVQ